MADEKIILELLAKDDMSAPTRAAAAALAKMSDEEKDALRSTEAYSDALQQTREAGNVAASGAREASKGIKEVEDAARKSKEGVKVFGLSLTDLKSGVDLFIGGVGKAIEIGKQIFETFIIGASDAQESASKFDTVFGGVSGGSEALKQHVDDLSESLGQNRHAVTGWMANLGDLFQPLGFTADKSAELSEQVTRLALDLSSFSNIPVDEALERIQGTLIGSHENALKFGVVINENTLKAEMAANGWDKLSGSQLENAKVQARLNLLMAGTTAAQGDLARTSDSVANQMKSLGAELDEAFVDIGAELIPFVKEAIPLVVDLVKGLRPVADVLHDIAVVTGVAESSTNDFDRAIQQLESSGRASTEELAEMREVSELLHKAEDAGVEVTQAWRDEIIERAESGEDLIAVLKQEVDQSIENVRATEEEIAIKQDVIANIKAQRAAVKSLAQQEREAAQVKSAAYADVIMRAVELTAQEDKLKELQFKLSEAMQDTSQKGRDNAASIREQMEAMQSANEKSFALDLFGQLSKAYQDGKLNADQFRERAEALNSQAGIFSETAINAAIGQQEFNKALLDPANENATKTVLQYRSAVDGLPGSIADVVTRQGDLNQKMEDTGASTDDLASDAQTLLDRAGQTVEDVAVDVSTAKEEVDDLIGRLTDAASKDHVINVRIAATFDNQILEALLNGGAKPAGATPSTNGTTRSTTDAARGRGHNLG